MPEEFRDGNYGFGNPTTPADKDVTDAQLSNLSSVEETAYGSDVGFYETNHAPPSGSAQSIPQDDVRYRQEHEPYNYQPDGDQFVYITKAHLYEIHPLTLGLIKRHELTPLKIKLDSAKGCVYTQFKTTDQGKIEGDYGLLKTDEDDPPDSVPFALPDGDNNAGTGGTYNVLLFKFSNGEIIRNHYSTDEEGAVDPRSVKHYGGVEGHRGPLFWSCGYNRIKNVGTGDGKIFKDYTIASDSKNLRTLKEADYSGQSTPFSTDPQINIATSGDEITVRGNSLNEEWTTTAASGVSGYSNSRIAVVQDGLIKEKTNLEVVEVPTSSGSSTVTTVSSTPTTVNTTVDTLTTTSITPPSGTGMSLDTKTYTVRELSTETLNQQANAWQGGDNLDLVYHEVENTSGSNVFVLGVSSTPADTSVTLTAIVGASRYTGVKNLSSASVELYKAHSSGNHKYLGSSESDTTTNTIYITSGSDATTARTFITSTGTPIHVYSESESTTSKFLKTTESDGATVPIVSAINTTASTVQTISGSAKVLKAP